MGSFDREPTDWGRFADVTWAPRHVIFCDSKWTGQGAYRHDHETVAEVRDCYAAARDENDGKQVWPCDWLLEGRYDDGSKFAYPCGTPARFLDEDGSFTCVNGHEHISQRVRAELGWEYAEDEDEASRLRGLGIDAVGLDGGSI